MKNSFLAATIILLAFSCGSDDSKNANDSAAAQHSVDSALNAQQPKIVTRSTDTVQMLTLPPVHSGDIVFQNFDNPGTNEIEEAGGGKYNHVGIIFQRPRDGLFVVLEALDTVHLTDLRSWVARGKDKHVALFRLKNANALLSDSKTKALIKTCKGVRGKKFDYYLSWTDTALYNSELVWKAYHYGLNVDLCPQRQLSNLKLDGPLVKDALKKQYGKNIPKDDKVVMPDDIYKSDQLELIYEK